MTVYSPDTILLDGTEDQFLDGRLAGVVDGKQGAISLWMRRDDAGGVQRLPFTSINTSTSSNFVIRWEANNTLRLLGERAGVGPDVLRLDTSVQPLGSYIHVIWSWDMTNTARRHCYVDDASDLIVGAFVDDFIAYDSFVNDYLLGTLFRGSADKWPGAICDLYFNTTEYIDLSIEANRRKFIDADGNPVYLGADGALPTGTSPAVYMSGNDATQLVNGGTGGDFQTTSSQQPDQTPGPVVVSPGNAPVPYLPQGILFDGVTDFQLRGGELQSLAAGKQGTIHGWIRVDAGDGSIAEFLIDDLIHHIQFRKTAANNFQVTCRNSVPADILVITSTNTILAGSGYHHVLVSWRLNGVLSSMYIDDISVGSTSLISDDTIAWSGGDWAVGARPDGTNKFAGAMSDLYFIDRFFDLTVEANRRNFIDSSGNPVFLGEDGSIPTGTFPSIYQPGSFLDQGFNGGRGGDFVSQGVQVPGETPGPVQPSSSDAEDAMRHLARRTARFHRFFRG